MTFGAAKARKILRYPGLYRDLCVPKARENFTVPGGGRLGGTVVTVNFWIGTGRGVVWVVPWYRDLLGRYREGSRLGGTMVPRTFGPVPGGGSNQKLPIAFRLAGLVFSNVS